MTTWVLVADTRRARIFQADTHALANLQEIHTLLHPQDHRHSSSGADPRRRVFESDTSAHHAAEPRTAPRELDARNFAREIASFLQRECDNRAFDDLVVVAGPRFMGTLRDALGDRLAALVIRQQTKELTALPAADLAAQLQRQAH